MRGLLALVLLGGVLAVGAAPGARNSSALTSPAGSRAERINFCLDGWDNFRGDCFYLENNPASWGTAERLCAEREGSLASAHSAVEYNYLQRLAQTGGHTFAWLGGYHFLGEWRWEGGSPFDYVKPESDVSTSENQCLIINTEGTKGWSNHRCNNFFPYICEMRSSC
ncbi:ladderlectin-like [Gadus chalcogrammus]|uniref:ladderlectin-like n=1 Tax=Gadus chalcogrammus TaxID=1042646 RepID=UPI0024C30789|nr:ladderlectin-like [Gadus chalcogrammus]